MNLPNKLTLLRVILVPVFLVFVMIYQIPYHMVWALIVFCAASVTDWLDGHIARKNNLITNFGKFLDPLADKLLVMTALIAFTYEGFFDPVAVVVILSREFMVTGLRLVVAGEGIVVAAGIWGKLKTAFTMVALIGIMFMQILWPAPERGIIEWDNAVFIVNEVLIWICVVLTVVSGFVYLRGYSDYIDPTE